VIVTLPTVGVPPRSGKGEGGRRADRARPVVHGGVEENFAKERWLTVAIVLLEPGRKGLKDPRRLSGVMSSTMKRPVP
jgi:hypothetical protein